MKEAIHALKYDRLHPAARRMGAMLGWDDAAQARSQAQYEAIVAASRRFRTEPAT
jgi:hypothetical protein